MENDTPADPDDVSIMSRKLMMAALFLAVAVLSGVTSSRLAFNVSLSTMHAYDARSALADTEAIVKMLVDHGTTDLASDWAERTKAARKFIFIRLALLLTALWISAQLAYFARHNRFGITWTAITIGVLGAVVHALCSQSLDVGVAGVAVTAIMLGIFIRWLAGLGRKRRLPEVLPPPEEEHLP